MIRSLTDNLLARQTTGVPRRMALGALFVLISIFCVIFKALTWVGMDPFGILAVAIYCTVVAAGQALLFDGRRPRDASILVGSFAMPILVALVSVLRWWNGYTLAESLAWVCLGICSFVVSPIIGYLVGIFLAGGFLLFEYFATGGRMSEEEQSATPVLDGQTVKQLRDLPSWIRKHPLVLVATTFGLFAAFCGFVLLFQPQAIGSIIPQVRLLEGAITISAFVALLTGISQIKFRALLVLLLAPAAGYLLLSKLLKLHFAQTLNGYALQAFVLVTSVLVAVLFVAALGWLQLLLRRLNIWKSELGASSICILFILFLIATTSGLWFALDRVEKSPAEQAIKYATDQEVWIHYARSAIGIPILPPRILMIGSNQTAKEIDDALLQLQREVDLTTLRNAYLQSAHQLTDRGVAVFDQARMWNLSISASGVSPKCFTNIDVSAISYLDLSYTKIDDSTLADLVPKKTNQFSALRAAWLKQTEITDDGLKYLTAHPALQQVNLDGCQITGEGFAECQPTKNEMQITLAETKFNDQGVTALLKAFPKLSNVDLCDTQVTESGLRQLFRSQSLTRLSVSEKQFPKKLLDELIEAHPDVDLISVDD